MSFDEFPSTNRSGFFRNSSSFRGEVIESTMPNCLVVFIKDFNKSVAHAGAGKFMIELKRLMSGLIPSCDKLKPAKPISWAN